MKRLKMRPGSHRIIHIDGNNADARMMQEALTASKSERYDVEWVGPFLRTLND
jgi:hypothetical protein